MFIRDPANPEITFYDADCIAEQLKDAEAHSMTLKHVNRLLCYLHWSDESIANLLLALKEEIISHAALIGTSSSSSVDRLKQSIEETSSLMTHAAKPRPVSSIKRKRGGKADEELDPRSKKGKKAIEQSAKKASLD